MTLRLAAMTAALLLAATPAAAAEDRLELWLNPAVTADLDDRDLRGTGNGAALP
jgi:hypothetical protein